MDGSMGRSDRLQLPAAAQRLPRAVPGIACVFPL